MSNAYRVVHDFESAVADYTGAPYVVAVNSCSMALLLAVAWCLRTRSFATGSPYDMTREECTAHIALQLSRRKDGFARTMIEIPRHTYVSVPMSIIHAGGRPEFRDEQWLGSYQLKPLPVWDCARMFTRWMYEKGTMQCVSFHASKILGDTQGGAILLDDPEAAQWMRLARFDGREEGVAPKDQRSWPIIGYHCYMSPDVAARLLLKLHSLPQRNHPLPNDDYPDLSQMEIFK